MYRVILLALLTTVIVAIVATEDNHSKGKNIDFALSDEQGTSRLMLFRFLPQYSDVDFGANFNKLKSSGDTAYFVVRDTIVYLGVQLMWVVIHSLVWDGKISNYQDMALSLLSPGVDVQLSTPSDKSSESPPASSRFTLDSLSELSFVKIWNYFTDPNPSTRNLYLNIGFALGSQLLWILPSFLGTLPDERTGDRLEAEKLESLSLSNETTEERLGGLPSNLLSSSLVDVWNRLLSPQGVLQIVAVNILNWLGKMVFWTFMSSVPDLPAETEIGRELGRMGWLEH